MFRGILVLMIGCFPAIAGAVEPVIRTINLRGLQIGGVASIVIDGDHLGKAPRLLLPFPSKQELKPKATDKQASFDVTLPVDIVPGYYHLRVVSEGGVSLPVVIGVDRLPQRGFAAAAESIPIALHGTATGGAIAETSFPGKAGQKILVDVEAQRLGSKLRPVVHLYDARKLQLAWAWPSLATEGDSRFEATLPADGLYTVTVHDQEYAGPALGHFRLKIGQWSTIDTIFPPVVTRGKSTAIELLGNGPLVRTELSPSGKGAFELLAWPKGEVWSGPRPFVRVVSQPEVIEQPAGEKGQELPAAPVGVSGRIGRPFEEDRYRLPVKPGTKLRFEVFAERLGSPADLAFVIKSGTGNQLARAEDSPTSLDPAIEFTVPAKVEMLVLEVIDTLGKASPHAVYRLTVETLPAKSGRADLVLSTTTSRLSIGEGGRALFPILIQRRGFEKSLEMAAESLPPGFRVERATIPDGADGVLATIVRDGAAEAGLVRWIGKSPTGDEELVKINEHPLERLQPWLAAEIALAPTTVSAKDLQIDWRDLPADTGLVPGKRLRLPVRVIRGDEKLPVKVTLLTSQTPIPNAKQPDPNLNLRVEKAVELAAKMADAEVAVLVPTPLSGPVYDVSVQAELLTTDKKTVLATAYAPVRRLTVRPLMMIQLEGPPRIAAVIGKDKALIATIKGKVNRLEGLDADIAMGVSGLPPSAKVAAVTIKREKTEFELPITFPAETPVGEIGGVRLQATAVADPKQSSLKAKSPEVEVTVVIGG